jgi:hypothetical protein
MGRIASFHLIAERGARSTLALPRLGTDRVHLRTVPGLRFWRLLGTGRGDDTGPGIDPRRTAMFAVWDSESDLDSFLASHSLPRRWAAANEAWTVRLRLIGGHGRWRGVDPLVDLDPGERTGRIAVVTRASVRPRSWRAFGRASHEVDRELHGAAGLIDVVGIGEAPIGKLATFSLWETDRAVRAYAFGSPRHRRVIDETRAGRWYSEELFARFEPYGSSGTWDGRDPLSGSIPVPPR